MFLRAGVAFLLAYEVLSDREKRSIYDQYGEEGLKQHASGGGRGAGVNIQDIFAKYDKISSSFLVSVNNLINLVLVTEVSFIIG